MLILCKVTVFLWKLQTFYGSVAKKLKKQYDVALLLCLIRTKLAEVRASSEVSGR